MEIDNKIFSVAVPAGTETLTIIVRRAGGETILDILVVQSEGSLEIEYPIFEEKIYVGTAN